MAQREPCTLTDNEVVHFVVRRWQLRKQRRAALVAGGIGFQLSSLGARSTAAVDSKILSQDDNCGCNGYESMLLFRRAPFSRASGLARSTSDTVRPPKISTFA